MTSLASGARPVSSASPVASALPVCGLTISATRRIHLAAKRFGPSDAAQTIVYVHGMNTDGSYWHRLIGRLTGELPASVAHLVYDIRGHGDSTSPSARSITELADHADDLAAVLGQASGATMVVGHSAGNLIIGKMADRYPELYRRLAAAVMFSPAAEQPEFPAVPDYFLNTYLRLQTMRGTVLDPVASGVVGILDRQFNRVSKKFSKSATKSSSPAATFRRCDPRALCDMVAAVHTYRLTPRAAAVSRTVPTLVLGAEKDAVVPAEQAQRLAACIDADFEIAERVGHSLPVSDVERAATAVLHTWKRARAVRV